MQKVNLKPGIVITREAMKKMKGGDGGTPVQFWRCWDAVGYVVGEVCHNTNPVNTGAMYGADNCCMVDAERCPQDNNNWA